jgi:signal peptidase I
VALDAQRHPNLFSPEGSMRKPALKMFGNLLFYGISLLLVLLLLGQIGILPFKLAYIRSGSMTPTYQIGDLVLLYSPRDLDAQVGDVILFTLQGEPVIHRAVAVDDGKITTKGDANPINDPIMVTHPEGKVLFAVPILGYAFAWLQSGLYELIS